MRYDEKEAEVSQNGQDNKCSRSSQSKPRVHFAVAAHEYPNVMGDRVSAEDSSNIHKKHQRFFILSSSLFLTIMDPLLRWNMDGFVHQEERIHRCTGCCENGGEGTTNL